MRFLFITALFLFISSAAFSQFSPDSIEVRKGLGTTFRQGNQLLKPKDLASITSANAEAAKEMQLAKQNFTLAQVLSLPGGFLVGFPIGTALADADANWTLAAVGAGLIVASVPFTSAYNKRATRAARLYNQSLHKPAPLGQAELKVGFTGNGIGLVLKL